MKDNQSVNPSIVTKVLDYQGESALTKLLKKI